MENYLEYILGAADLSGKNANALTVCDKDGIVLYHTQFDVEYATYSKDFIASFIGKHILAVRSDLTPETSTIVQVLKTGKAMVDIPQQLTVDKGYVLSVISSTVPIDIDGEIVGVIDYSQVYGVTRNGEPEKINNLVTLEGIITKDPVMVELKSKVQRAAWSDSSVLIYGETGTGKELFAESMHTAGPRCQHSFIAQNCAAIPENLLESIFFGTEKGSFTGAESKKGLFELADGGTLFLDEINSMPMELQVKLLKTLEEKKCRRIGGTKEIKFDVRIICATNEPIKVLLNERRMREDLYYRIGVIIFEIPPLRERKGDIPLMIEYFSKKYSKEMGCPIKSFSPMVEEILNNSKWPGNVRQLKNVVESAYNLARGDEITVKDIPDIFKSFQNNNWEGNNRARSFAGALNILESRNGRQEVTKEESDLINEKRLDAMLEAGNVDLEKLTNEFETLVIKKAIMQEGRINKAAEKLSVSPQRLHYKIDKYNLKEKMKIKF